MRRIAIAIVASICLLAACFPHNKKARRTALLIEGATTLAGVGILAAASPGADCPMGDDGCISTANTISGIGVVLLMAGIGGLVATVSSAEEAEEAAARAKKLDGDGPIAQPTPVLAPAAKPVTKN